MPYEQGGIYWVNDGGSVARPFPLISREDLNQGDYLTVVPFTTRNLEARRGLPNCVPFNRGEFGLTKDCVAQCEAIQYLPKAEIARGPDGPIDDERLRAVVLAIGYVVDAECAPPRPATAPAVRPRPPH